MSPHHGLDHAIVHGGHHGSRIRIVPNDEVVQAIADLQLLFPHDSVLTTAIGCCHTCLYTNETPASLVAERIAEHIREFDHSTGERRTRPITGTQGLGKDVWK